MKEHTLASHLAAQVVQENVQTYVDTLENADPSQASDGDWKDFLELYGKLAR